MHALPNLLYAYDALEPYIDEQTMRLHHLKHHQAYIDKLNAALEPFPEWQNKNLESLLRNLETVPETIRTAVCNHGGGHWNHSFFWQIMVPANSPETKITDKIKSALEKNFNNFESFQKQFKDAALARFGSGWVWLIKQSAEKLAITSTANQDVPFADGQPILGLDVWEHAYYLKYQNRRADYLDAFFKVINWQMVAGG